MTTDQLIQRFDDLVTAVEKIADALTTDIVALESKVDELTDRLQAQAERD